jgi:hypothetical protein
MSSFTFTDIPPQEESLRIDLKKGRLTGVLTALTILDKDTNQFVGYLPAVEISGYGPTEERAEEMMQASLKDFFEYLIHRPIGLVQEELLKLGWKPSFFANKKYSKSYVDIQGILQNFNIEKSSLKRHTLSAA